MVDSVELLRLNGYSLRNTRYTVMKEVLLQCLDAHLARQYTACKEGNDREVEYNAKMVRYYEDELALLK